MHSLSSTIARRIMVLFLIVLVSAIALLGRLIYLQIAQNHFYQKSALDQRLQAIPVDARRGTIYDRNGVVLAISVSANAVYAIPAEVDDKEATARILANILELDYEAVLNRLNKKTASEWIKKRVSNEEAQEIHRAQLRGIGIVDNPERFYPYGSVAPQILGIVGIDNQGLEGIELYYDQYLRGVKGKAQFERDAHGNVIEGGVTGYQPGVPGADLILTLDFYIQKLVEAEVQRAALETGSRLAVIIIMDPSTGEILANAVYPSYDLLNYQEYPIENRRNIAVTDTYEPGSTFKAITVAAALDSGVATLNTHFFDPGFIIVSGWTIRCWNRGGHGSQSFVQTLENSCNPFYAKLGIDMGGEIFYRYLRQFNLGEKLGVDFPGEAPGTVRPPSEKIPLVTWANIGFGQGLTCTPMQLLAGFATIANKGILMVPHYVKEIVTVTENLKPDLPAPKRVIPQDIAAMTSMALRSAIENGSGKRADVPGYDVAGKTGTAQLVEFGRYSHSKTVTSFAGYAPEKNPEMAGLIVLWEPQGAFYGGIIASPIFARLVEQILPYLGVKPTTAKDETEKTLAATPEVVGEVPEEAVDRVQNAGLEPEIVGGGSQVIGQVPAAGALVSPGTKVYIYTNPDDLPVYSENPFPIGV